MDDLHAPLQEEKVLSGQCTSNGRSFIILLSWQSEDDRRIFFFLHSMPPPPELVPPDRPPMGHGIGLEGATWRQAVNTK